MFKKWYLKFCFLAHSLVILTRFTGRSAERTWKVFLGNAYNPVESCRPSSKTTRVWFSGTSTPSCVDTVSLGKNGLGLMSATSLGSNDTTVDVGRKAGVTRTSYVPTSVVKPILVLSIGLTHSEATRITVIIARSSRRFAYYPNTSCQKNSPFSPRSRWVFFLRHKILKSFTTYPSIRSLMMAPKSLPSDWGCMRWTMMRHISAQNGHSK